MRTILILALTLLSLTLTGQTVISFTSPIPSAPTMCNDAWVESGVPQQLIPIPPSGTCSFDYSGGDLWLYAARLTLDLSTFNLIESIEVDLIDWCGFDCSELVFFENGIAVDTLYNTVSNTSETLVFNNVNMYAVDSMTVQGYESQFFEIRINDGISCDEAPIPQVSVQQGDVYIEDACYGIILTSPNGSCYRVIVDDNGTLISQSVECP